MTWMNILKKLAVAAIPVIVDFGKKMLEKIASTPSMSDNSSIADIEQISDSLYELREHVLQQIQPTIRQANYSLMHYIEEQLTNLDNNSALLEKYQISSSSVELKLQALDLNMRKFWKDSINRQISLDNQQCRSILMLPSGAKKSANMKKFTDEVLTNTLNEYADLLRNELSKLYVGFESDVTRSVSHLESTISEYNEIIQSLNEKDDDKYERLIAKAKVKIFCYDVMLEKVRS